MSFGGKSTEALGSSSALPWTQELWNHRENVKLHFTDAKAYMLFIPRPLPASQWGLEGSSPSEGEARAGEEISLCGSG